MDYKCALLCSWKNQGNQLKHAQIITNFLKCAKRKRSRKEKYKEHKTNFEGVYLHDGYRQI